MTAIVAFAGHAGGQMTTEPQVAGADEASAPEAAPRWTMIWFALSLLITAVLGLRSVHLAFSAQYVVQDDARQHVWWMQRFIDPGLFPGDHLADYFQAVAPPGYRAIYEGLAWLGLDPMVACKLLPVVIALVAAAYCFRLSLALFPLPFAAFLATLMFTVRTWTQDDVVSGTSRAFFHPLFVAFLYYVVIGAPRRCLIAIALMALIYPQTAILALAILGVRLLWSARPWPPAREVVFVGLAGAVALVAVLPFAYMSARFGPTVTLDDARQMPEWRRLFSWHRSFGAAWHYFIRADETGLLPLKNYFSAVPFLALALPMQAAFSRHFPAVSRLRPGASILVQVLVASLGMFVLAHLTLFHLYLPSRYTQHSLWLVGFLAGGIAVAVALEALRAHLGRSSGVVLLAGALAIGAVAAPLWRSPFASHYNIIGQHGALYEFLARQPKDILVASIADEADNLPSFARRSVLLSFETYNAFHLGFSRPTRACAVALIQALYDPAPQPLQAFVRRYDADYLLLDGDTFTLDYLRGNRLIRLLLQPEAYHRLIDRFRERVPHLARDSGRTVFEDRGLALIDVRRFRDPSRPPEHRQPGPGQALFGVPVAAGEGLERQVQVAALGRSALEAGEDAARGRLGEQGRDRVRGGQVEAGPLVGRHQVSDAEEEGAGRELRVDRVARGQREGGRERGDAIAAGRRAQDGADGVGLSLDPLGRPARGRAQRRERDRRLLAVLQRREPAEGDQRRQPDPHHGPLQPREAGRGEDEAEGHQDREVVGP